MGMSIDEAIKVLKQHHMWTGEPQEIIDVKVENSAIDVAIDTMRKYQKIQEIINIYDSTDISYKDTLQDIKEVLEDGNNNTNQNYYFDS